MGIMDMLLNQKLLVDTFIKSGMVVGLGSGLASCTAIQYLGPQLRVGAIKGIVGIPTSVGSASEAAKAGIPLDHYQDTSQVCMISKYPITRIYSVAEKLVFIVTEKQYKSGLEGSIPVLIKSISCHMHYWHKLLEFNWMETAEEIKDLFLGDAEVQRDFLLITREGHNVLDVIFTLPILNLVEVANTLDNIDEVVDHGVISKIPQVEHCGESTKECRERNLIEADGNRD
ncbi:hypothetical protein LOK49_LG07G01122 [Camellia lanceoleosa]|uniref:Uncharacterized protein n=1 Tax=Camellia lanceoleosa TaxID=1840588 RepID=A0ACC0H5Y4_9ERIC|nr:hypothetical protein LOK49_LG07G01122 [Camellia lanceoleosa]